MAAIDYRIVFSFYWFWGELRGSGDLRLYILVQYLPMLILPILFIWGKYVFSSNWGYWLMLAIYILAKIAEHFDGATFRPTNGLIAGHAIKHVLVVIGIFGLLSYFRNRTVLK